MYNVNPRSCLFIHSTPHALIGSFTNHHHNHTFHPVTLSPALRLISFPHSHRSNLTWSHGSHQLSISCSAAPQPQPQPLATVSSSSTTATTTTTTSSSSSSPYVSTAQTLIFKPAGLFTQFKARMTLLCVLLPLVCTQQPLSVDAVAVIAEGQPRVVDGDTLVFKDPKHSAAPGDHSSDIRVRLFGIDAPESKQTCSLTSSSSSSFAASPSVPCGSKSAEALRAKIGTSTVTCKEPPIKNASGVDGSAKDRYGREVAVCYARNEDLNAWLVKEGHAVAYERYYEGYHQLQEDARTHKRGIWAYGFQNPEEFRKAQREQAAEHQHHEHHEHHNITK